MRAGLGYLGLPVVMVGLLAPNQQGPRVVDRQGRAEAEAAFLYGRARLREATLNGWAAIIGSVAELAGKAVFLVVAREALRLGPWKLIRGLLGWP